MSIAIVTCRAQLGLHAPLVHVEVSLSSGLPVFSIVGLPATVVKESKDRVRAALVNSNFDFPAGRITVNLSPADIPKRGGRFDLPIALGILLASEQIKLHPTRGHDPAEIELYGELVRISRMPGRDFTRCRSNISQPCRSRISQHAGPS